MRVLVCGGRDFNDGRHLCRVLDTLHQKSRFSVVIHGAQRGADFLAGRWAKAHGIAVDPYKAEWTHLGRAAGPIRNRRMLEEGRPDLVVAFPGGSGTANMVRQARGAGVKVIEEQSAEIGA